MNEIQRAGLLAMINHGTLSKHPVDNQRAVLAIRSARASGFGAEAIEMVKRARASWLTWLTITQRQWQRKDRSVHADRNLRRRTGYQSFGVYRERGNAGEVAKRCIREGIETRERYVRCGG